MAWHDDALCCGKQRSHPYPTVSTSEATAYKGCQGTKIFLKHQNLSAISYRISYFMMFICTSALHRGLLRALQESTEGFEAGRAGTEAARGLPRMPGGFYGACLTGGRVGWSGQ